MLTELFNKRRSYREFQKTPVNRDDVRELIKAADQAPVSCNLELTQYVVVDDPELLEQLRKRVSYKFRYAPTTIVVMYDPRFTVEHESAVMTAGMQVENLILRATELGLATCPMAGFGKDDVIKEVLNIPEPLKLLLLIAVGHPSEHVPYPIKKLPVEETYRYNSYGLKDSILNGSPSLKDHTSQSLIQYRSRISSVYLDRFTLRTYDDGYYADAFAAFEKEVLNKDVHTVLDLMSYDGLFIQTLAEKHPEVAIIASDYIEHNLEFYKFSLGVHTALISPHNELSAPTCDAVSFVFQSDFTPDLQVLLQSASASLKVGGKFFIATVEDTWYKRMRDAGRRVIRKLGGKKLNIYEGNPFYKVGPREPRSLATLEAYMNQAQCLKVQDSIVRSYPTRGVRVRCSVFEKQV